MPPRPMTPPALVTAPGPVVVGLTSSSPAGLAPLSPTGLVEPSPGLVVPPPVPVAPPPAPGFGPVPPPSSPPPEVVGGDTGTVGLSNAFAPIAAAWISSLVLRAQPLTSSTNAALSPSVTPMGAPASLWTTSPVRPVSSA